MTTENIGTKYNTQIPALSENADIQTALRIYHYGQSSEPSTLNAQSISGYLSSLEATKVSKDPTEIVSGAANNLNLKLETGYYSATSVVAAAGSNYPTYKQPSSGSDSGTKYGGLLEVVNEGIVIYQTYHMINPGSTGFTAKAWRGSVDNGVTWTPWKQALHEDHVHDSRYYLKYSVGSVKETVTYNAKEVDDALLLKATLAGPATFSGTGENSLKAVTQLQTDTSTRVATTEYVTLRLGTAAPLVNAATAVVGTSLKYAREDHVHPTDLSRASASSVSNLSTTVDTKPTTLLGKKSDTLSVPAGTKRVVIARENPLSLGNPDATITPVEGDLWFW